MQSSPITIGADIRYIGETHSFLRGQTVRVVAVHRRHLNNPDTAEIIDNPGAKIEAGPADIVEVAPYVAGRLSWATSDALASELEAKI